MSDPRTMFGVHLCWGAYGFWLPNDPRGSGSTEVLGTGAAAVRPGHVRGKSSQVARSGAPRSKTATRSEKTSAASRGVVHRHSSPSRRTRIRASVGRSEDPDLRLHRAPGSCASRRRFECDPCDYTEITVEAARHTPIERGKDSPLPTASRRGGRSAEMLAARRVDGVSVRRSTCPSDDPLRGRQSSERRQEEAELEFRDPL